MTMINNETGILRKVIVHHPDDGIEVITPKNALKFLYDDIVFLRDINIETHCEHHMVPILGKAHVAYLPKNKVVGISKLARVIEIFAKRLQTQETMTMQILNTIDDTLEPYGSAIMIDAKHQCMTTRGINKPNVSTVTTKFSGSFSNDTDLRQRFMQLTKE